MRPFDLQRMVSFFLPGEDGHTSRRRSSGRGRSSGRARSNGAIELSVVYEGERKMCTEKSTDYLA